MILDCPAAGLPISGNWPGAYARLLCPVLSQFAWPLQPLGHPEAVDARRSPYLDSVGGGDEEGQLDCVDNGVYDCL